MTTLCPRVRSLPTHRVRERLGGLKVPLRTATLAHRVDREVVGVEIRPRLDAVDELVGIEGKPAVDADVVGFSALVPRVLV